MKKILMISRRFYPHIGGVETFTDILGRKFLEYGSEIFILTKKYDKNLKKYEEINNLKVYRYKNYFDFIFLFFKLKINFKFDFVISNQLLQESMIIGIFKFFKLLNIKIIGICHTGGENNEFIRIIDNYKRIYKIIIFFIFKLDKIVLLNLEMKKQILKYFPKVEKKLEIIYNGLDFGEYKFEKKRKIKNILYLSRFEEKKGIFNLINAFKNIKNKNIFLNIVGVGNNDVETKIISEIKNDSRIKFLGKKIGEEKEKIFIENDLFVLPSYYEEGHPFVLMEAMKYNLVILTSKVGSNFEVYGNNIFYTEFGNLKENIIFLIENIENLEYSYEEIVKKLDINTFFENYLNLLKN